MALGVVFVWGVQGVLGLAMIRYEPARVSNRGVAPRTAIACADRLAFGFCPTHTHDGSSIFVTTDRVFARFWNSQLTRVDCEDNISNTHASLAQWQSNQRSSVYVIFFLCSIRSKFFFCFWCWGGIVLFFWFWGGNIDHLVRVLTNSRRSPVLPLTDPTACERRRAMVETRKHLSSRQGRRCRRSLQWSARSATLQLFAVWRGP